MAAVGMAEAVAVVHEDVNLLAGWAVFICRIERGPGDGEHAMPCGKVVICTYNFGQTQLSVIEVYVGAAAGTREEAAAHILWVVE